MAKKNLSSDTLSLNLDINANSAQLAIRDLTQANKLLEASNREAQKEMTRLIAAGNKESKEYRVLSKEIKDNNAAINENRKAISDHIKTLGLQNLTMKQLQKQAKDLQIQLNNTSRNINPQEWSGLNAQLIAVKNQMGQLAAQSQKTGLSFVDIFKNKFSLFSAAGSLLSKTISAVFSNVGNSFRNAFNTIKDFEQANANLASILGVSRKEIADLTGEAKRLGATTQFTASQVTLLQTELAKLGFDRQQIIDMNNDILAFATATGAELPNAAALAGAAMRAFGLEAKDMNRVVSTMAVATTKSALSFSYLDASMSTIAPVAKSFGFTIEDTVALLGTLANAGFDASSAATATRNILLNLADSNGKLAVALGRPIRSLDDLVPAFDELRQQGINLNTTLELTDRRSVAAFNTFLDNAKSVTTLRDSVTDAGGALQRMVDERLNTLQGSLLILQSAWEGLMLSFSNSTGPVKAVVDALASMLSWITQIIAGHKSLHPAIAATAKAVVYLATVGAAYWAGLKLQTLWNSRLAAAIAASNIRLAAKRLLLKLTNAELAKHNILVAATRSLYLLFSAASALLSGNITKARAAMVLLNQTIKANPIGLLLSLIATVVVAIQSWTGKTRELSEAQKIANDLHQRQNDLMGQYTDNLLREQKSVNDLVNAIVSINDNTDLRLSLIKKLKVEYPDFIAFLNAESVSNDQLLLALRRVNDQYALRLRNASLQAKIDANSDAQIASDKRKIEIEEELQKLYAEGAANSFRDSKKDKDARNEKIRTLTDEYNLLNQNIRQYQSASEKYADQQKQISELLKVVNSAEYYKKQLESLQNARNTAQTALENAADTDRQRFYQNQVEYYDKEIETARQHYEQLSKVETEAAAKAAAEAAAKETEIAETQRKKNEEELKKNAELKIKAIDIALEQEINIRKNRRSQALISERDYNNQVNQLTIDALKQKLALKGQEQAALVKYESQILDLQLKMKQDADNAAKEMDKIAADSLKSLREAELADADAICKSREEDLRNQLNLFNQSVAALNLALAQKSLSKQQHELLMIALEKSAAEQKLMIERDYLEHARSLQLSNNDIKEKLVEQGARNVLDAEKAANEARLAEQTKLNDLIKDFKGEFKVTTVHEDYNAQLAVLEAAYRARKELAEKNNLDSAELDMAYFRAKEQLQIEHEDRLFAIRQQYGLVNEADEYNMQVVKLQNQLDLQLISQKDYEKALQKLRRDSCKKQFDYYKNLFSDAINALQNAEIANIEAKYDVEIEAAKGNVEEVERLELEKAQRKLDVEKKYADVNFAIKASQIIADTAVGVMAAFQLGPIAGAIAAAIVAVTGIAQLAMANAERNKVKNMTLSSAAAGAAAADIPKTGARVASGRERGGRIDVVREQDGKFFPDAEYDPDRRGFVERPVVIVGDGPAGRSKEWIASNAAVENPTVAPVLQLIDRAQQAGAIRSFDLNAALRSRAAAGFAEGGPISRSPQSPQESQPPQTSQTSQTPQTPLTKDDLVEAFIKALAAAEFTAPVVLSELEARRRRRDAARRIGSKR
jgi:TP901 family phage tail tape measure protein